MLTSSTELRLVGLNLRKRQIHQQRAFINALGWCICLSLKLERMYVNRYSSPVRSVIVPVAYRSNDENDEASFHYSLKKM